jgi:hypothetical protein
LITKENKNSREKNPRLFTQGKSFSRGTWSSASRDLAYAEELLVSTRFLRGLARIPVVLPRDRELLFADAFV